MLAPGDAPPLSLACILQPSGDIFCYRGKNGFAPDQPQIREIRGHCYKFAHFAKFHEGQVVCFGQSVNFFILYLMMLCFFLIPFPDYNL